METTLTTLDPQVIINTLFGWAPRIAGGILIFIIGWWIAGKLSKMASKLMEKRNVDAAVRGFLSSSLSWLLKLLVILSVLGTVGVELTSFAAILAALSLAIGMSLSGTLQNIAGGVIIMIFKNFKPGDYVELSGYSGTVVETNIFSTVLNTPDNVRIVLPNGPISNSSLKNYSSNPTRRHDLIFSIAYGDEYDLAVKVLKDITLKDERILKDPEPFFALHQMADSSVNVLMRVWVNAADYWAVLFDTNEKVYKQFAENGLSIPFPQMDVHVLRNDN